MDEIENLATPEVNAAVLPDPTPSFNKLLSLNLTVTAFDPPLGLHNKRFLQLERQGRATSNHAGGIDTRVSVDGFHTDSYTQLVYESVKSRKEALGTKPRDISAKLMKKK